MCSTIFHRACFISIGTPDITLPNTDLPPTFLIFIVLDKRNLICSIEVVFYRNYIYMDSHYTVSNRSTRGLCGR